VLVASQTTESKSHEYETRRGCACGAFLHALQGRRESTNIERMRRLSCATSELLRNEARCVARRFRFPDYRAALAFANAVSVLAEESWRHPELVLGWGFCEVSLTTRKIAASTSSTS
jgi:pterin-4a-carbinolamine dehydratase